MVLENLHYLCSHCGEMHVESGSLEMPASWVVAHVAQETPALPVSAIDFVLDGDVELRAVEKALVEAETNHQGERIGELHQRLTDIDGYSAKARAAELLNGLGFSQQIYYSQFLPFLAVGACA